MAEQYFNPLLRATAPENYERYFVPVIARPLADDLLREADLKRGERVLDAGCGTGVVARLAAERVGGGGAVVGVDVNPGMLAVARSVASPALPIDWQESSAESLPLPDESFDVVLCQMSLQFMSDRENALQEMHRVLVPGGRLIMNLPGPAGPPFETLATAMGRHISPQASGFVRAVFSLHDESALQELLRGAGFQEVSTHADMRELTLPPARDFLWQYVGSTPLAGIVAESTAAARSTLEQEVLAGWAELGEGEGISYRQRVVTASARR